MRAADAEELAQAYRGEGPLFREILAARRRELARAADGGDERPSGSRAVVVLCGRSGRWAVPLDEVARVDTLPRFMAAPLRGPPFLGLGLVAGRRCLLVDLEALATGAPLRPRERSGYALVLRGSALAMVVDRAEAVSWQVPPAAPVPAAGADGVVWLDGAWLKARLGGTAS